MIEVTCPDCGKMAYIERFERSRSVDGPKETVRQVRCATQWRTHVHVIPEGEADPPSFNPQAKLPGRPGAPRPEPGPAGIQTGVPAGPRPVRDEAAEDRDYLLLSVLRSMRLERQGGPCEEERPSPDALPVVRIFPRPTEERTMSDRQAHPKATRARAMELVLEGRTHAEAAREVGVPTTTVSTWARRRCCGGEDRKVADGDAAGRRAEAVEDREEPGDEPGAEADGRVDGEPGDVPEAVAVEAGPVAPEAEGGTACVGEDQWERLRADIREIRNSMFELRASVRAPEVEPMREEPPAWDDYQHALSVLPVWDDYQHALGMLGCVTLERLARIEDVDEQACVLRLVFRGNRERLSMVARALGGGAA